MKTAELKIGKPYLLRGGLILRYRGLYNNKGPCLAFGPIADPVSDPPVGYSASEDEVLQELGRRDIVWLRKRAAQATARNLHQTAADCDLVIAEIRKGKAAP